MTVPPTYTIRIPPSDRAVFFGRTGTGKTTLAKVLLNGVRSFVVLDAKHTFRMGSTPILPDYDPDIDRQIVRVPPDYDENDRWQEIIDRVWRTTTPTTPYGRVLYLDELTLLNPSAQRVSVPLGRAIRTGRERRLGVWCGSQRPMQIPSAVFTEAEHIFTFALGFDKDREKVASFSGETYRRVIERLGGHRFAYYDVREARTLLFDPVKPFTVVQPTEAIRKGAKPWDSWIRRWVNGSSSA